MYFFVSPAQCVSIIWVQENRPVAVSFSGHAAFSSDSQVTLVTVPALQPWACHHSPTTDWEEHSRSKSLILLQSQPAGHPVSFLIPPCVWADTDEYCCHLKMFWYFPKGWVSLAEEHKSDLTQSRCRFFKCGFSHRLRWTGILGGNNCLFISPHNQSSSTALCYGLASFITFSGSKHREADGDYCAAGRVERWKRT